MRSDVELVHHFEYSIVRLMLDAAGFARDVGATEIGTPHILLSLLGRARSHQAVLILNEHGLTESALEAALRRRQSIWNQLAIKIRKTFEEEAPPVCPQMTPLLQDLCDRDHEASFVFFGHMRLATVFGIATAILEANDPVVEECIGAAGVDAESIIAKVMKAASCTDWVYDFSPYPNQSSRSPGDVNSSIENWQEFN